ncbi:DMT family transporter [Paenibacillus spongiae]|uniref:Multidrug efflux SMR transporter n=1 Tax=Paenibacillus spongiae TaxID=2909671 RepID=A0ABY5SCH1_9BACL|nr:multidrug efflux SMR transporter [Paenibacillus spongiae]UVI29983.1 multidrug efflux SMR transporter [Paenibacillus spongiae]
MAWVYLLVGGMLEIGWAFGLRASEGFTILLPSVLTVIMLAASFYLFAKSMRIIEVGTAYAVFTGIGTAGTVLIGMLLLNEPADWLRLFFVALLVGGIIGLKMISSDDKSDKTGAKQEEASIQAAQADN